MSAAELTPERVEQMIADALAAQREAIAEALRAEAWDHGNAPTTHVAYIRAARIARNT